MTAVTIIVGGIANSSDKTQLSNLLQHTTGVASELLLVYMCDFIVQIVQCVKAEVMVWFATLQH